MAILPSAATGHTGPVLRGFGTAVIDATPGPGEWDSAARIEFAANRAPVEGGGTVPATLYVMNDRVNIYLALRVANASVGFSTFQVAFDNDHDGSSQGEIGDEGLHLTDDGFGDLFLRQTPSGTFTWARDDAYGGSQDGVGLDADHPGFSFYELSHPLDTPDNSHDFGLGLATRVGLRDMFFAHCPEYAQCAYTSAANRSDIVIVSGSRVPPETQISGGPAENALVTDSGAVFEFTGTDDVLQSTQLTFECKVDDEGWEACTSPYAVYMQDGRHAFSVRATDEMLNVDPTPALRSVRVDTTGPSKPVIRGRRSVRAGKRVVLRFSAKDALAGGVRYRCAVDSRRLKRCSAVLRVKLRPGRHVVRVKALDRVGNESELSTARIRVKRR